jgi:signal recognition particle subunit SRP54
VLTKTDGDARGGAALSVRAITGKPIKFIGTGEKVDALQPFHPQRIASRILGMGDVLSLVEDVQRKVDQKAAEKLVSKMRKGGGLDLEDFRSQLEQMANMGGISTLMDKLPGMTGLPRQIKSQVDDRHTLHMIAMINSMTVQERRFPEVIRGSRKRRIALGSGTEIQDVNRLLKQHGQMQKMMKKMGKVGMSGMMKKLRTLQGQLPPGMMPGRGGRKPPF